jgi:exopolysaccharide biosynthesis polyprenyl glycosylphosphotransferase
VLWSSSVQFAVAWLICVALPVAVGLGLSPRESAFDEIANSGIAASTALFLVIWFNRSLSRIPGAQSGTRLLTSYLGAAGLVLAAILFFRIDYSRSILAFSGALGAVLCITSLQIAQNRRAFVLGVIPGGHAEMLYSVRHIECVELTRDSHCPDVDAIAADFRIDHDEAWQRRIADLTVEGFPVYHSKDLHESLTGRADVEHLSENNLGALSPLASIQQLKSAIDRTLALVALVVLLPVMIATAVAIRLDSPGPALFRQARMGFRGRPFTVYKFRTMRCQPTEVSGGREAFITRDRDARITRLGAFLRKSRIDELPQLINVLRGEMSWIGPRPEALALSEWYEKEIPFYRYRHVVVPGITGWAQINQGHVAQLDDVKTKLQYDFYYIRNFSIWLDLLIVAKTVKAMLTGFGAR